MIQPSFSDTFLFCPWCTQDELGLKALMEKVQQIEEETNRINEDIVVER